MSIRLSGKRPKRGYPDRRSYMLDVQVEGRRIRMSTRTRDKCAAVRKEQAVIEALMGDVNTPRDILEALVLGKARSARDAIRAKITQRTLKEAFSDALNDRNFWRDKKSVRSIRSNCTAVLAYLGDAKLLNAITQGDVDELVDRMKQDGAAAASINRKMHTLFSALRREERAGRYTAAMPEYRPTSERDNARQFVLTLEDEALILQRVLERDALPEHQGGGRARILDGHDYHDLFVFLVDVGCRLSQAFAVRWADIESDRSGDTFVRFWRVGEQKGGSVRTIPCTARVADVLTRRRKTRATQSGPFAGMTAARAGRLWRQALEGTHLESEKECVIHALRHTCATRMLQATGDIKLVQEWIGHRDIQTTASVYAKVMVGQKLTGRAALEAFMTPQQPTAHSLEMSAM